MLPGPCDAPAQVSRSVSLLDQHRSGREESCSLVSCLCVPHPGFASALHDPLSPRLLPVRRLRFLTGPNTGQVARLLAWTAFAGREDLAPASAHAESGPYSPGILHLPVPGGLQVRWLREWLLASVDFACPLRSALRVDLLEMS